MIIGGGLEGEVTVLHDDLGSYRELRDLAYKEWFWKIVRNRGWTTRLRFTRWCENWCYTRGIKPRIGYAVKWLVIQDAKLKRAQLMGRPGDGIARRADGLPRAKEMRRIIAEWYDRELQANLEEDDRHQYGRVIEEGQSPFSD